jgi:predicted anti-sigma-YlaC factor YlaD
MKRVLFFSCQRVSRLVSESIEHSLPRSQRVALIMHFAVCSACRAYRRQVIGLDRLIRLRMRQPVQETMTPDERQRLLQRLGQR